MTDTRLSTKKMTPEPTGTLTPEPTGTFTPEPTPTSIPLILGPLNPYLVGVGEHGAMVCLRPEDPDKLNGVTLQANIIQFEKVVERIVSVETIGEFGLCFEVVDAKYTIGQVVSIEIKVNSPDVRIEDIGTRTNLGEYGVVNRDGNRDHYPFLKYIFPEELGLQIVELYRYGNVMDGFHPAIDFTPFVNSNYATLENIPVYSPVTGKVLQVGMDDPGQAGWQRVNNIVIESQYTGWLVTLGHLAHHTPNNGLLTDYCSGVGINYTWTSCTKTIFEVGQHIGFINVSPLDPWAAVPHVHIAVTDPSGEGVYTPGDLNNIDPTYLWLSPPDVIVLIKGAPIIYK